MPEQNSIELRWIFSVIRRWWWLIVGGALLGAVVAIIFTAQMQVTYEATTTLLIQPAQDTNAISSSVLAAAERLALTYSEMLKGRPVLETVIAQNQLSESVDQLVKRVSTQPVADTQLIRLTVEDSVPTQAVTLANAIAKEFTDYIQNLQAERYAGTINDVQDKMSELALQIEMLKSQIQTLNTEKVSNDAQLARLESLEADSKDRQQQLEQQYQNMQLTVSQLADSVSIAESAQVSFKTGLESTDGEVRQSAILTLLFDQSLLEGEGSFSIETYQKILTSMPVLQAAIDQLGLQIDPAVLTNQISLTNTPGTQLVKIEVVDPDIAQATNLADTIAAVFIERVNALQTKPYTDQMISLQSQIDSIKEQTEETQADITMLTSDNLQLGTEIDSLEGQLAEQRDDLRLLQQEFNQMQLTMDNAADSVMIAEHATVPKESSRHRLLYIGLAGVISGAIALGAAFLIEHLNDSIQTAEDIRQIQNTPTLGSITRMDGSNDELVTMAQPRSPVAEAFRILATHIQMATTDRSPQIILVTSPNPEEGKSLVAGNLAAVMAQREFNVVLVDADLRLPRQHELFGIEPGQGLTKALQNGSAAKQLQAAGTENLRVLTSGELPPNPAELLASKGMTALLDEMAGNADLVLVDCSPILPVADASILASVVDGVILVVRAGHTRRQELRDAVENLDQVGANVIGVVLNGVSSRVERYYQYYGGQNESGLNGKRRGRKPSWGLANLLGRDGLK